MRVKKYYKLVRVDYEDSEYFRFKNVSNESGIFKMVKNGNPLTLPNLEYSLDGVTWTTYDFTTLPEVIIATGSNIYFRGTNATGFNGNISNNVSFSFNKTCESGGNICSLFNTDPVVFSAITTIPNYAFANLFKDCVSLTKPFNIGNVTSLGEFTMYGIFDGCTSLTTPPDLSNVTSFGAHLFRNAFKNCTSLTTAPDLSNATSIGDEFLRDAFFNCTSLTTAPDLSNVTYIGGYGLSNAFQNCTSLTAAPDLSNVTSIGSTSLDSCYRGCSKLSEATAPNIQNLTTTILNDWLRDAGTQATGTNTVRVPTGATIATGSNSGIPTGWTRVDY